MIKKIIKEVYLDYDFNVVDKKIAKIKKVISNDGKIEFIDVSDEYRKDAE